MRVSGIPATEALASEVQALAAKIGPAKARWLYALSRATMHTEGGKDVLIDKAIPGAARLLGTSDDVASHRLHRLLHFGFHEAGATYDTEGFRFEVGALQQWTLGHVYYLRVKSHPHVVKVGFTRRLAERVEEIAGKVRTRLVLSRARVGTQIDEHWSHASWADFRIEGEWFFDPFAADRTLPPFLADAKPSDYARSTSFKLTCPCCGEEYHSDADA